MTSTDESAGKMVRWLVGLHAKKRGWSCEDTDPDRVTITSATGPWDVSIDAVRRRVGATPRGEWSAGIAELLDELCGTRSGDTGDFESVRPRLRTRLYPEDVATERSLVRCEAGQDIVEVAVIDGASTMTLVTEEMAAGWPDDLDLLSLGRENVRAGDRPQSTTFESHGVEITLFSGDDYTSTHMWWLDSYGLIGPHGALVSVPTRTTMLVCPITDDTGWEVLAAMAEPTCSLYEDEDGHPLVRRIYHWDQGGMDTVDMMMGAAGLFPDADGAMNVVIHPDFQEMFENRTSRS